MKKLKIKLQLKTHTVRTLQVGELDQVNGGLAATLHCSEVATSCCPAIDALDASGPKR